MQILRTLDETPRPDYGQTAASAAAAEGWGNVQVGCQRHRRQRGGEESSDARQSSTLYDKADAMMPNIPHLTCNAVEVAIRMQIGTAQHPTATSAWIQTGNWRLDEEFTESTLPHRS
ncbi:hypothetical protein VTI28DRAFT_4308 [Corynascus sepedonium]